MWSFVRDVNRRLATGSGHKRCGTFDLLPVLGLLNGETRPYRLY